MSDQTTINDLVANLRRVMEQVEGVVSRTPRETFERKVDPKKWSKKEILGHLIDSGVNNLQRFTECQFKTLPYVIRRYDQDALVLANKYQQSDVSEVLDCWKAINVRIAAVVGSMTPSMLVNAIVLPDGTTSDLGFLIKDYVDHMEHHLRQLER